MTLNKYKTEQAIFVYDLKIIQNETRNRYNILINFLLPVDDYCFSHYKHLNHHIS